jgi:hypothetical protein
MGNHFHLLVGVPSDGKSLSAMRDTELLRRMAFIYDKREVALWKAELKRLCKSKVKADHSKRERIREGFFARMHDLASFVGEVKQRFSQWHNRRWNRHGTLYEERYKSVLVEGSDIALRTMAAYIDLNPVRAHLVKDPADWRWSGYGEAVAGVKSSREALCELLEGLGFGAEPEKMRAAKAGKNVPLSRRWKKAQADYRCWLYAEGRKREEGAKERKGGFTDAQIDKVEEEGGEIAVAELLHKRVRYFHDGAAIGCRGFLEEVFRNNRKNFGPKRKQGARKMGGGNWGELMAMRDLRGG